MLGGADNPNGELLSYIIGADIQPRKREKASFPRSRRFRNKKREMVVTE